MKIRIVPILLLLGLVIFGLALTGPTRASAVQTNNTTLAANYQAATTATVAVSTPALTTPAATTIGTNTPEPTPGPTQTPKNNTAATTSVATLNNDKGSDSVGLAVGTFLQGAEAAAQTADNQETSQSNEADIASQPIVAVQTAVVSEYGEFDLSRLRIENLLPSTLRVASVDDSGADTTGKLNGQFQLDGSGVIPDTTAKILAAEADAPKLWPVKGTVTSTFGPRQTLVIPTATESAAGKGGAGPTTGASLGQTITLPATTPTPTPTTTTAALTATAKSTATSVTPTVPTTPTLPTTTPAAETTISPTVTTGAGLTSVPATPASIPATTPDLTPTPTVTISVSISATSNVTITATPGISATVTVSPTVTPTATPWPSGPIPTINGILPAVGADDEYHTGLDIAVPEGTEVRATADGVVLYAGDGGGYGRVVFIQHAGGFVTVYGHNSKLLVEAGQTVKAGQVISLSGSTGYSTGPHVHYEVRYDGKIADPAYFLGLKN